MNVVDSCGWLEYLADGRNADFFGPPILKVRELLVPTASLYEVFKRVMQQRGQSQALQAVALMQQGQVVELDATLALEAAKLSLDEGLPMVDSLMLATARAYRAVLWTQDADFARIEGVRYVQAP